MTHPTPVAHREGDELINTSEPQQHYSMLIGGERVGDANPDVVHAINPFNGRRWATAPQATQQDVDNAVGAARAAFETGSWADASPAERATCLRRLGGLIEDHWRELAELQVRENGKLIREMGPQTAGLAGHCYYFAGIAETITGRTIPTSVAGTFNYTTRAPMGVVAAVTPWNSPLSLLMWKLAPALAAGNTMVIKPSEVTPVSTLRFADLISEAGFPAGTVNVVSGDGRVGAMVVNHPGVDKIAFTGSTDVGRQVALSGADRFARVSLELGGKSPNIVFADSNADEAVVGVMAGIFGATGQTCLAGSRVLVDREIYEEFAAALCDRARAIKLGDPFDPDSEMGTVSCQAQLDKVMSYVDIAVKEGASLLCGGGRPNDPALREGLFFEPTIFGEVRNDMRIAQEEVFGPVACLIPFNTEEDAIRIANDTQFGLAAGVWSENIRRAHRVAGRLRAGTVWINSYRRMNYAMPFGGFGASGIGRENGADAVHDYTEIRSTWVNLSEGVRDPFNPRAQA